MGVATVAACTVFAAISGSSVATALTIGSAAIPLMIRYGYSPRVAYGVVGGGGTLGILIPPSGPMVLFGVVSDTSIGALFMAGVVPGLMLAAIFALYCMLSAKFARQPLATEPRATFPEVLAALRFIPHVQQAAAAGDRRSIKDQRGPFPYPCKVTDKASPACGGLCFLRSPGVFTDFKGNGQLCTRAILLPL
jgi:MFS family permease